MQFRLYLSFPRNFFLGGENVYMFFIVNECKGSQNQKKLSKYVCGKDVCLIIYILNIYFYEIKNKRNVTNNLCCFVY